MKRSKKYAEKVRKKLLTSMLSIATVTTLIAGSNLVGFSAPIDALNGALNYISAIASGDGNTILGGARTGESSTASTYIYNAQDLVRFRDSVNAGDNYLGKSVYLMADIDLSTVCSASLGSWRPIADSTALAFRGKFEGNGHTVSNLYINTETDRRALFNCNSGLIQNLTVKGQVTGSGYSIGGIVGSNYCGVLKNCVNYVNVTNTATDKNMTGGVAGEIRGALVIDCINYGTVMTGWNCAGGIAGYSYVHEGRVPQITGCKNYGSITATSDCAGGIVPDTKEDLTIYNCHNYGEIKTLNYDCVGGIMGNLNGTNPGKKVIISDCSNSGKISAGRWAAAGIIGNCAVDITINRCKNSGEIYGKNGNAGGIMGSVGYNDPIVCTGTIIESCLNTGYIHSDGATGGPSTGGILATVQFGEAATIRNCYNTGEVSLTATSSYASGAGVGGIVGSVYSNNTATSTKSKVTIINSYNIGTITHSSSSYKGLILGRDYNNNRTVTNCYYLSTLSGKNTYGGTSVTATNLKNYAPTLGSAYVADSYGINGGYPILEWQAPILKLNINQTYMNVGDTLSLELQSSVAIGTVTWTSYDESIAKVDSTGKVTAVGEGYTTVYATESKNGYRAMAVINVIKQEAVAYAQTESGNQYTMVLKEDGTVWRNRK